MGSSLAKALPHWSCYKFLDEFRKLFNAVFLFLFMLLFCMLLVCEVPMLALKFKDLSWEKNKVKFIFLLGCLPCFLLGTSCFAAIIMWYVALSIISNVMERRSEC